MNDYENLLNIIKNKYNLSLEFLNITNIMQRKILDLDVDSIEIEIDKRQNIMKDIDILDKEFLIIFNEIKKNHGFENNIKKYPSLKEYIKKIQENFNLSYNIDKDIIPVINKELNKVKNKLKEQSNKTKISNKYAQDITKKIAGANFGIFIDEMK